MKISKFFINFLKSYASTLLGAGMISLYIWLRFIRERLPKDIPFSLNTLGFLLLLEICFIYAFIIYIFFFPRKSNEILNIIVDIFYIPLEKFDYYWKHIYWFDPYYKRFIYRFTRLIEYSIVKYPLFYLFFYFLPRFILITTLLIDIFYFNKLFFIYKVLLVGVLLFLRRYIIYSIKMYKNDLISLLEEDLISIEVPYVFGIHPSEWPENYDPDDPDQDDICDFMYLSIDIFIEYYVQQYMYNNTIIEYLPAQYTLIGYKKQRIMYNVTSDNNNDIPFSALTIIREQTTIKIENILYLALLLEYYSLFADLNPIVKRLKIFIYVLYLICWSYILLKCASIDNIYDSFILFQQIFFCQPESFENPVTGLFF